MYKEDLALNKLQWLIWHKTQPNQIKPIFNTLGSSGGNPSAVVANLLDFDIIVSKFEPQSNAFTFGLITLGKVWTSPLSII